MSVNSRLNRIIGQRKAFYRHRIPESSCARKETVGIDILVVCGQFPDWIVPRLTLPLGQFPDWNFPDGHFPDGHFPTRTFP